MSSLANNKRRGAQTEQIWCDHLRSLGHSAVRVRLNGVDDLGDVHQHHPDGRLTVWEVKSGHTLCIGEWLRELAAEIENVMGATERVSVPVDGALVVRPRGVPDPARWWIIRQAKDVIG